MLERLTYAFDRSPIPTLVVLPDRPRFTIAYANQSFFKALGVSEDGILGKPVFQAFSNDDNDWSIERRKKIAASFEQVFTTHEPVRLSNLRYDTLSKKSGERQMRFWNTNIYPILDQQGRVEFIVQCPLEITEFRNRDAEIEAALEKYDILSNATSDVIYEWNITTSKVNWNRGLKHVFGYDTDMDYDQRWWYGKVHPDDVERVVRKVKVLISRGGSQWQAEYRFRCADNTYKAILDKGFVLYDVEGNAVQLIGAMQDISEKVVHLKAIEDQNKRFQEIAWAQSHLVRAPLSRIMGLTALLADPNIAEVNLKEVLPHLMNSATELDKVIRDIVKKSDSI